MPDTVSFIHIPGQRILYTDSRYAHGQDTRSQGYPDSARAEETVLLCIHGAGGTHLHWPPLLRSQPTRRVLALDLPGHGDSTGAGRATIAAYADSVAAFVHALGLTSVVVAGHSMGGAIALELALRSGRAVSWLRGLVLVGTGARLRVADALLNGLQHDFAATTARIGRWLWGPTASPLRSQLSAETLRRQGREIVRHDFLACHAFDVRAQLPAVSIPTLVIGGQEDVMTPPGYSTLLAERIPNARLLQLANAGHMMALEYPQQVTSAVVEFVNTL